MAVWHLSGVLPGINRRAIFLTKVAGKSNVRHIFVSRFILFVFEFTVLHVKTRNSFWSARKRAMMDAGYKNMAYVRFTHVH